MHPHPLPPLPLRKWGSRRPFKAQPLSQQPSQVSPQPLPHHPTPAPPPCPPENQVPSALQLLRAQFNRASRGRGTASHFSWPHGPTHPGIFMMHGEAVHPPHTHTHTRTLAPHAAAWLTARVRRDFVLRMMGLVALAAVAVTTLALVGLRHMDTHQLTPTSHPLPPCVDAVARSSVRVAPCTNTNTTPTPTPIQYLHALMHAIRAGG